jgi:hypothetical protein
MTMSRRAFTLLELLLVVTIMMGLAAVMIASYGREMDDAAMLSATDDIRAALARTRLAAIEEGVAYRMICYADGIYTAGPVIDAGGQADFGSSQDEPPPRWTLQEQLPYGVMFYRVESPDYLPAPSPDDEIEGAEEELDLEQYLEPDAEIEVDEEGGFPPIVFYPDGAAANAVIGLVGPNSLNATIVMRGLTGQVIVGTPYVLTKNNEDVER